jgi:hypothetical protein
MREPFLSITTSSFISLSSVAQRLHMSLSSLILFVQQGIVILSYSVEIGALQSGAGPFQFDLCICRLLVLR